LGLETSTPAGKAMFQMLGVFAAFEPPRSSGP
jgi:DNA invertase Pin-like site-specific DNA recombinase